MINIINEILPIKYCTRIKFQKFSIHNHWISKTIINKVALIQFWIYITFTNSIIVFLSFPLYILISNLKISFSLIILSCFSINCDVLWFKDQTVHTIKDVTGISLFNICCTSSCPFIQPYTWMSCTTKLPCILWLIIVITLAVRLCSLRWSVI